MEKKLSRKGNLFANHADRFISNTYCLPNDAVHSSFSEDEKKSHFPS